MTDATGHVTTVITKVDGTGAATVPLPASAGLPAIVHAQYDGAAKFVVTAVDAAGHYLSIAAQSLGKYDGTFPLGFVDQHNDPTGGLSVATTGPWHLDIAVGRPRGPAGPAGACPGTATPCSRTPGPATSAEVSYPGKSTFTIETFAGGVVNVLTNAVGPYDRQIALPAGPAFISVTAGGNWSIKLG